MDKPAGPTSHDVVARVRRLLRTREVGHTGTLDPFATGLMVLLLGRATRLARFIEGDRKQYLATARLGWATTTDDATGEPTGRREDGTTGRVPERAEVEALLTSLVGPQWQRPPAYSAKHVDGERSYQKARRGEVVALAEVEVVVHAMELVGYEYPELRFRSTVSAGTYVRALARDLGERLGVGAHLTALRREAIGGLTVEQAVGLEALTAETPLLPPLALLGHLDRLMISEEEVRALGFGRVLRLVPERERVRGSAGLSEWTAAVGPGDRLVALGRIEGPEFRPQVVLEAAVS